MPLASADSLTDLCAPNIRTCTRIVNSRGVPGTLACIAQSASDGRQLLLANHHVLFGAGARAHDAVWLAGRGAGARLRRVGRTRHGRLGTVNFEGDEYHVDCAVASVESIDSGHSDYQAAPSIVAPVTLRIAHASAGERVTKLGVASGHTTGVVVDPAFNDVVYIDGRMHHAPRQLLIRSADPRAPFSTAGDSGALILNKAGEAVAMLTGITIEGDSIACHIAPVFHVLHLRFA